jgi:metallo-beta-lactamase family protein
MHLTFHGAAQTVTGSQHLLTLGSRQILLDCGLYQGKREEARRRNQEFPFAPAQVEAVILSHAHIDHSGNLPNLVKQGFRGPIFSTPATADLCRAMLLDSGHIQEEDVAYVNRKRRQAGEPPVEPLYTREEAAVALKHFRPLPYGQPFSLGDGLTLTFYDAGHMLGSALVVLDFTAGTPATGRRLVFTGDLGRTGVPLLRDPVPLSGADVLILESTYGSRTHPPLPESAIALGQVIRRTATRGGKVIIPAFAVERTQLLVFLLNQLYHQGELPDLPVFVDSPLAADVTEVFRRHPECLDEETRAYLRRADPDGDIFGFRRLRYIREVEDSKALHGQRGPAVIISASGMAEAGRIQHHLKNNIGDPRNTILIVGWQAPNTLGRRLVEQAPVVRIFGQEYRREAEVVTLNGFSGHADQPGLLEWVSHFRKPPQQTFVVHGEPEGAQALAGRLKNDLKWPEVLIPELHQRVELWI